MRQLLITDIDGTLIDSSVCTNHDLVSYIGRVSGQGDLICSTGRHFYQFTVSLKKALPNKTGIYANGALGFFSETGNTKNIFSFVFSIPQQQAIQDILITLSAQDFPGLDIVYYGRLSKKKHTVSLSSDNIANDIKNIFIDNQNIIYLTGLKSCGDNKKFFQEVLCRYSDYISYTLNVDSLLMTPYSVNKSTGVEHMLGYIIEKGLMQQNDCCTVAGNDRNDIAMLTMSNPLIKNRIIVGSLLSEIVQGSDFIHFSDSESFIRWIMTNFISLY